MLFLLVCIHNYEMLTYGVKITHIPFNNHFFYYLFPTERVG